MANNTWMWVVLGVIAVVLVANGTIDLGTKAPTSTSTTTAPKETLYPATLLSTVTLNTKDALASSDTNANVSYYVFDKAGNYITGGTTSAGVGSFSVNYIGDYELIAFSNAGYYPVYKEFSIASGEAAKTLNLALNAVSTATISTVRNPVDLTTNITAGQGQTVAFDVLYTTTSSAASTNKPVIVVDVNQTAVQDVNLGGLSKATCPQRLTSSAGRKKICFQDNTILSTEGIRTLKGTLVFSQSIAPSSGDTAVVTVMDTQGYTDPNFAGKGKAGFHEGTENINTLTDVGAADSSTGTLTYA